MNLEFFTCMRLKLLKIYMYCIHSLQRHSLLPNIFNTVILFICVVVSLNF